MMTRRLNDTGSAIIGALFILLMMGLIGVAAIQTSESDMNIADNYKSELRSFYTAEAGAELTFAVLRDSLFWRDGFTEQEFKGGHYTTVISDSLTDSLLADTILIRSTGMRSDAISIVEVKLAPTAPFRWAAFADDYFKLCGGTSTDSYDSDAGSYAMTHLDEQGDVGSNGHIKLCGSADIEGDVSTSSPGDLEVNGGADFHDSTSVAPPINLRLITQSQLDYALANTRAPGGLSGQFSYNNGSHDLRVNPGKTMTLASGVYYFGDIDLKGTVELDPGASVQIYVVGDVSLNAQADINTLGAPRDFMIFSVGSSFTINGGAEVHATLYAPTTEFKLTGGADLYGAFLTKEAQDAGGSSFHYDRSLKDLKLPGTIQKVAWQEL